jgi:hypothetical protein
MNLLKSATSLLNESLTLRQSEQAIAFRMASRAMQNANEVLKAADRVEKAAIKVQEAQAIATPINNSDPA